jgi:molybdopterin converting factor small subunit
VHLGGEDGEQPGGGRAAAGADGAGVAVGSAAGAARLGGRLRGGADHPDAHDAGGDRPQVRLDVRYFAGAAAAAGLEQEVVLLDHQSATLGGLLAHLRDVHPPLARVLAVATALVDELAVTDGATPLRDGARVDVLPPFAGG